MPQLSWIASFDPALDELIAQEVGAGAMTTALMKQVLVTVIRRSLRSKDVWAERFCLLSDPHVARAFAEMAARPGGAQALPPWRTWQD